MGFLLVGFLSAGGTHYRAKGEILFGGFTEHFEGTVGQLAGIPKRLAFFSDNDGVAEFQVNDGAEERHTEGDVVRVGQGLGQRKFIEHAMAGFALNVFDGRLVFVDVTIPHGFVTGVAVHAVEGVFTFGKLGDWLVVVVKSVGGLVGTFVESHCPQVVVAAVVTGIALIVGDCSGERMDF